MLRYRLRELMERHHFQTGKRLMVQDIQEATGISRATLSRFINKPGTVVKTDVLDKLCEFFDCRIEDLVEYVPRTSKKPKR
jgi:putative transcriptional regulator